MTWGGEFECPVWGSLCFRLASSGIESQNPGPYSTLTDWNVGLLTSTCKQSLIMCSGIEVGYPFHSQVQRSTFTQPFKEKCRSDVVRIGSIIMFHLSKLWKAKFFMLCDIIFLVGLQDKFEIDRSWEWLNPLERWGARGVAGNGERNATLLTKLARYPWCKKKSYEIFDDTATNGFSALVGFPASFQCENEFRFPWPTYTWIK